MRLALQIAGLAVVCVAAVLTGWALSGTGHSISLRIIPVAVVIFVGVSVLMIRKDRRSRHT